MLILKMSTRMSEFGNVTPVRSYSIFQCICTITSTTSIRMESLNAAERNVVLRNKLETKCLGTFTAAPVRRVDDETWMAIFQHKKRNLG